MHICLACLLFCIKKERGNRRKQKYTTVQNAGKHQLISLNFKKKKNHQSMREFFFPPTTGGRRKVRYIWFRRISVEMRGCRMASSFWCRSREALGPEFIFFHTCLLPFLSYRTGQYAEVPLVVVVGKTRDHLRTRQLWKQPKG